MYSPSVILKSAFLAFLPVSELRGSIPFAIINGIPWYGAFFLAVLVNALVAPACWVFLSTIHRPMLKVAWYKRIISRFLEKARTKLHAGVEKWGWLGVALFVAIPFPLTGAWTGTMGAWVLGLAKGKTMAAVTLGVFIAGVIVTAVMVLGIETLNFFIKKV